MSWLSLVSLILSAVGNLIQFLNSRQLLDAGAQQEIARQQAAILAKQEAGRRIMAEIHNMSDEVLTDWLQELGRH